jgi:hypothetical protein
MNYKFATITIIILCIACGKCFSQGFDSVHVYAVYMKSMYRIKIDKDLIKNEVEPIVLTDEKKISAVHSMLMDTVKGSVMKKLKSNQLDIRLSFEFFKKNKVVQIIGVTPHNTMFINHVLYAYDKQKLKCLDRYITGLSKTLGIK